MTRIERGDTFFIREDKWRGAHFTCVGTFDSGFYAGDTNGRMYKFVEYENYKYELYLDKTDIWDYCGKVKAESINEE